MTFMLFLAAAFWAQEMTPTEVPTFHAETLREYSAPDADQGVAVDEHFFYAVDNYVIAKHDRETGKLLMRFDSGKGGPLRHMNSCRMTDADLLECANSNYSLTPMASSVEWFDPQTMEHVQSHSLGLTDEGSLTFTDRLDDGYLVGFAHYSKKGGEPYKDNSYSALVTYDDKWRRTGGYAIPPSVTTRMAPYAASGGAIGPDGRLYLLGHDLPEMYVLEKPVMGPMLVHVATIELEANGQAFTFDPSGDGAVWTIDRHAGKVRHIKLPKVDLPMEGEAFVSSD